MLKRCMPCSSSCMGHPMDVNEKLQTQLQGSLLKRQSLQRSLQTLDGRRGRAAGASECTKLADELLQEHGRGRAASRCCGGVCHTSAPRHIAWPSRPRGRVAAGGASWGHRGSVQAAAQGGSAGNVERAGTWYGAAPTGRLGLSAAVATPTIAAAVATPTIAAAATLLPDDCCCGRQDTASRCGSCCTLWPSWLSWTRASTRPGRPVAAGAAATARS